MPVGHVCLTVDKFSAAMHKTQSGLCTHRSQITPDRMRRHIQVGGQILDLDPTNPLCGPQSLFLTVHGLIRLTSCSPEHLCMSRL